MTKYYLAMLKNPKPFYIFADILEIAEGNEWSHVEVVKVVDRNWDEAISYGSVFPKSRSVKFRELQQHYVLYGLIPLVHKIPEAGCDHLLESLTGKIYSFGQIVLIALRILTGFSVMWLNKAKPNLSKNLICTELVGIFMQEACQYRFEISPEMLSLNETKQIAIDNLLESDGPTKG
jgi:hypothetical protein